MEVRSTAVATMVAECCEAGDPPPLAVLYMDGKWDESTWQRRRALAARWARAHPTATGYVLVVDAGQQTTDDGAAFYRVTDGTARTAWARDCLPRSFAAMDRALASIGLSVVTVRRRHCRRENRSG